jgi:hypothetical protein
LPRKVPGSACEARMEEFSESFPWHVTDRLSGGPAFPPIVAFGRSRAPIRCDPALSTHPESRQAVRWSDSTVGHRVWLRMSLRHRPISVAAARHQYRRVVASWALDCLRLRSTQLHVPSQRGAKGEAARRMTGLPVATRVQYEEPCWRTTDRLAA